MQPEDESLDESFEAVAKANISWHFSPSSLCNEHGNQADISKRRTNFEEEWLENCKDIEDKIQEGQEFSLLSYTRTPSPLVDHRGLCSMAETSAEELWMDIETEKEKAECDKALKEGEDACVQLLQMLPVRHDSIKSVSKRPDFWSDDSLICDGLNDTMRSQFEPYQKIPVSPAEFNKSFKRKIFLPSSDDIPGPSWRRTECQPHLPPAKRYKRTYKINPVNFSPSEADASPEQKILKVQRITSTPVNKTIKRSISMHQTPSAIVGDFGLSPIKKKPMVFESFGRSKSSVARFDDDSLDFCDT